MDHLSLAQRFIERCVSDEQFEKPEAALEVVIERLGFGHFACCSHTDPLSPPPGTVTLPNYPNPWAKVFVAAELYKKDPVFKHSERAKQPFSVLDTAESKGKFSLRRARSVSTADIRFRSNCRGGWVASVHRSH